MDIHSISFPPGTHGIAQIIVGPTKRTYMTTTHAVAMALLGSQGDEEAADSRAGEITWQDHLATHGIAVGSRGRVVYTLAISPSQERMIHYTGALDPNMSQERRITALFPPILFGMAQNQAGGARAFSRAVVFALGSSDRSRLTATGTGSIGVAFPYGNVYTGAGNICWGSVPHSQVRTIRDLEMLFFGSDFNGDLYNMSGGRWNTLGVKYKGKALPLNTTPNTSMAQIVRHLVG